MGIARNGPRDLLLSPIGPVPLPCVTEIIAEAILSAEKHGAAPSAVVGQRRIGPRNWPTVRQLRPAPTIPCPGIAEEWGSGPPPKQHGLISLAVKGHTMIF